MYVHYFFRSCCRLSITFCIRCACAINNRGKKFPANFCCIIKRCFYENKFNDWLTLFCYFWGSWGKRRGGRGLYHMQTKKNFPAFKILFYRNRIFWFFYGIKAPVLPCVSSFLSLWMKLYPENNWKSKKK